MKSVTMQKSPNTLRPTPKRRASNEMMTREMMSSRMKATLPKINLQNEIIFVVKMHVVLTL